MGRNRVYEDQAERQRAYRVRKRKKLERCEQSLKHLREILLWVGDMETFLRIHLDDDDRKLFDGIKEFLEEE